MTALMAAPHLPHSTHPTVLIVLLDWLGDTLPGPRPPRYEGDTIAGFTTSRHPTAWSDCPACGGKGKRRKGQTCPTCDGTGGHYTDPMDSKRRDLRVESDARPVSTQHRLVRLSGDLDADAEPHDDLPPALVDVLHALRQLRHTNRYHRAILQRVHIIRLDRLQALRPAEAELHTDALEHLATLLPERFRAPRWCREKAGRGSRPA